MKTKPHPLLDRLRRVHPRRGERTDALYRIETCTVAELSRQPAALVDIQERQLDGVVIKAVYSPREAAIAHERMVRHRDRLDPLTFGGMLGYPLNRSLDPRDEYLHQAEELVPIHREIFGEDVRERFNDVFRRCSGGRSVDVPREDGRAYTPGTFRIMSPGLGGLKAHTGNEFVELQCERGMKWLVAHARMMDSMSYFMVLQKPDTGGHLLLADLLWEDTDDELKGFDQNTRDDSFFDRLPAQVVDLEPGDLVVFGAGRIWHKVSDIGGDRDRVTFGGFMALANDDDQLWYWG